MASSAARFRGSRIWGRDDTLIRSANRAGTLAGSQEGPRAIHRLGLQRGGAEERRRTREERDRSEILDEDLFLEKLPDFLVFSAPPRLRVSHRRITSPGRAT